jgi:hypothetical protein
MTNVNIKRDNQTIIIDYDGTVLVFSLASLTHDSRCINITSDIRSKVILTNLYNFI